MQPQSYGSNVPTRKSGNWTNGDTSNALKPQTTSPVYNNLGIAVNPTFSAGMATNAPQMYPLNINISDAQQRIGALENLIRNCQQNISVLRSKLSNPTLSDVEKQGLMMQERQWDMEQKRALNNRGLLIEMLQNNQSMNNSSGGQDLFTVNKAWPHQVSNLSQSADAISYQMSQIEGEMAEIGQKWKYLQAHVQNQSLTPQEYQNIQMHQQQLISRSHFLQRKMEGLRLNRQNSLVVGDGNFEAGNPSPNRPSPATPQSFAQSAQNSQTNMVPPGVKFTVAGCVKLIQECQLILFHSTPRIKTESSNCWPIFAHFIQISIPWPIN
jgi:hypothetical protein